MDLSKIVALVKERKLTGGSAMPQNSTAFLSGLADEVEEVAQELSMNRKPHLEDELGDILWDYLHLLYSLELEGKVEVSSVIKRCEKKYSERIQARNSSEEWQHIKKEQKQKLDSEAKE